MTLVVNGPSSCIKTFPACQQALFREDPPETTPMNRFSDFSIVKTLGKAKFPVYLIASAVDKENYAMKVFPFTSSEKPHPYFQNEARFSFVDHPNIIKAHHIEPQRRNLIKQDNTEASYIIMEYAPYGDFFELIIKQGEKIDNVMVRTYFKQLIDGVEYLHNNNISHMDLKLENLLLGDNFTLKIADFDLSHIANDTKILSGGSKFYRAPEMIQKRCVNTKAADIYALGIILFAFVTRGMFPHAEGGKFGGVDFAHLLYTNNNEFWRKHCILQKREASFFDEDFKELFNSMIRIKPNERPTIEEIKQSKWYKGPCYTNEELKIQVERLS